MLNTDFYHIGFQALGLGQYIPEALANAAKTKNAKIYRVSFHCL
jgi:hypothetical protein